MQLAAKRATIGKPPAVHVPDGAPEYPAMFEGEMASSIEPPADNLTHPLYCGYIPGGISAPPCEGRSTCDCKADLCSPARKGEHQAAPAAADYAWSAACCGCREAAAAAAGAPPELLREASNRGKELAPRTPRRHRTSKEVSIPREEPRRQPPVAASSNPSQGRDEPPAASEAREHSAKEAGARRPGRKPHGKKPAKHPAAGGGGVPEWCRYVPEAVSVPLCHSGACSCAEYCRYVPPGARIWDIFCCGCGGGWLAGGGGQAGSHHGARPGRAARGPPAASGGVR